MTSLSSSRPLSLQARSASDDPDRLLEAQRDTEMAMVETVTLAARWPALPPPSQRAARISGGDSGAARSRVFMWSSRRRAGWISPFSFFSPCNAHPHLVRAAEPGVPDLLRAEQIQLDHRLFSGRTPAAVVWPLWMAVATAAALVLGFSAASLAVGRRKPGLGRSDADHSSVGAQGRSSRRSRPRSHSAPWAGRFVLVGTAAVRSPTWRGTCLSLAAPPSPGCDSSTRRWKKRPPPSAPAERAASGA